jgi:glycine/D-amino acid oxidase-like deaminating enzyme
MPVVDSAVRNAASELQVLHASLAPRTRVDACIVGAGLAGLVAAYLIARERRSVLVLDDGAPEGLEPVFAATQLASIPDVPFAVTETRLGAEGARIAAQSHEAAIDTLEAIVRRERVACEFERLDAYGFVRAGAGALDPERECEAARRAGLHDAEVASAFAVAGRAWGPAARYPAQAQMHPVKFLAGLVRAVARAGGRFHAAQAQAIEAGAPACVLLEGGTRVEADLVFAARGLRADGNLEAAPAGGLAHVLGLRVARGSMPAALYRDWDTPLVTARLRTHGRGAGEVLLVSGEDPPGDDDHTAFRYLALEEWARARFPDAGEVVQRMTGQAVAPRDLYALAARDPAARLRYAGSAAWGSAMTRAIAGGLALRDFAEAPDARWAALHLAPVRLRESRPRKGHATHA